MYNGKKKEKKYNNNNNNWICSEQRSLRAHVRQPQVSFEERAQLAYHAAEAIDGILNGVDHQTATTNDASDASERSALLSLLYRDIQRSENWLVLIYFTQLIIAILLFINK
jgi:hypothetical protein